MDATYVAGSAFPSVCGGVRFSLSLVFYFMSRVLLYFYVGFFFSTYGFEYPFGMVYFASLIKIRMPLMIYFEDKAGVFILSI